MHKTYDLWPRMAKSAYENNLEPLSLANIEHIVLSGMGGSGAICEVLSAILSKTNIHTSIVKGYHLPNTVNENTLIVSVSVSGETIETFSALKSAFEKSCKTVSFSSGGKILQFCNEKKIPHYILPMQHSPRASFPIFLYSILNVLRDILPIHEDDIYESLDALENLQQYICSDNLNNTNPSLSLAKWLTGTPLLYYPWGLESAATRFKNSLNENSKTHAFTEDIVEATHNGVVAWERISEVTPIIICGPDDYIKTQEIWNQLEKFFTKHKIDYRIINSISGSILTKLVYLIYLCDYTSIYRSILLKTDPSPVKSIDYFKKIKI